MLRHEGTPVAVVGAGTMGAGIAEVAARAGHPVLVFDSGPGAAQRGIDAIVARLDRDVAAGRLDDAERLRVQDRLQVAETFDDLAECGVVVEAVAEDLGIKRDLIQSLEKVLTDDAMIATNTSSLSVTAIAATMRLPGRFVGLHFFNPATRMRLVEVVRSELSDEAVLTEAADLVRSWDKVPVVCTSTPGFIVNRVARPFYGEAQRLVEEGVASPAAIDVLLREAGGFPMGPFELTDLVGQDVNLAVSRSVWEQTFHDPRYAPTVFQQRLVDAGRLGRKSGRGVYRYDVDDAHPDSARPATTTPPRDRPDATRVLYREGFSVLAALTERLEEAGIDVRSIGDSDAECTDDVGAVLPGGGRLVEVGGPEENVLGEVVVLDWVLDAATTTTIAVAAAAGCTSRTLDEALDVLAAIGITGVVVEDSPGLVVARTVATLVNEAVDLVARGEASVADVDTAMQLGTRYPRGPIAWGDALGPSCVLEVLTALHQAFPTGRYRISPALRRAAQTDAPLLGMAH